MTDQPSQPQVVCVGAGIMSATLAMMLKLLQPDMPITIIERLDQAAAESSDAWNNAGTGHSAFCELNYTPERADGSVEIAKAVAVAEAFEISKQLWAFLAEQRIIPAPAHFIHRTPHMSFVWGAENAAFLRRRYAALQASALFHGMRHTEDPAQIAAWAPLIMEGRDPAQPVAATHMAIGTDVNFGALTRSMVRHLASLPGVEIHFGHEVTDLERRRDRRWRVSAADRGGGAARTIDASFVFIGAGGGSLPLLLKSQIPEGRGYGGFPVSGQWLVCSDETVVARHAAKVYGRASVGAPPMSVPHLDTRVIDGRRALFFGPYAGISTKFLKHGSLLDLPRSIRANNIIPMLAAGLDNLPLTKYLIEQVTQSPEERLATLREFYPGAQREDWELQVAGQRVQVIRDDPQEGGVLEFGTEVVSAADGSLAALLGASPGASTVVSIMLTVLGRCFPEQLRSPAWQAALARMIPTYGRPLSDDPALCARTRAATGAALGLDDGAGA